MADLNHSKALLIILDGFGVGKEYPFNAIQKAKMPFYQKLVKDYSYTQLWTHGEFVGLPDKTIGNSEVGHMTIGSGRVLFQDLMRIHRSIEDQTLFKNEILLKTIQAGGTSDHSLHLMGLLSDGGVHSHIQHLEAILDLCLKENVPRVNIHAFLDGRDTPPGSAVSYLKRLLSHPIFKSHQTSARLATVMGRYWAMDRDHREERTKKAYSTLVGETTSIQVELEKEHPVFSLLEASYQNGKSDEFVEPLFFEYPENPSVALRPEDALLFFNFRSDRARQITTIIQESKTHQPSYFSTMTEYDASFKNPILFPPLRPTETFPEHLSQIGLQQFRIAETEKYAHVTFFFNAGKETPFQGESRLLIPSPKDVRTYDQKPEMSGPEVTTKLLERLESRKDDFILVNYANPDMVGHTGNFDAAVVAMKFVDQALEKIVAQATKNHYHVVISADHGNVEEMRDSQGRPHTQHTLNPVPFLWIPESFEKRQKMSEGTLADIAPTLCKMMNIDPTPKMTGKCLLPC